MKTGKAFSSGFTLIEVLIGCALYLVLFTLIYQTFTSSQKVVTSVDQTLKEREVIFNFFLHFHSDVSCILPDIKSFRGKADYLQMLVDRPGRAYPVKVIYAFLPGTHGWEIWEGQNTLIFNQEFAFPVLEKLEDGSFSYFDGSAWHEEWDKEQLPAAILLKLTVDGTDFTLPVKLYHEKS